jgi:hypothetical protein
LSFAKKCISDEKKLWLMFLVVAISLQQTFLGIAECVSLEILQLEFCKNVE